MTIDEFAAFFEADVPDVLSNLFFSFVWRLVDCQVSKAPRAEEFLTIVSHICVMNDEEMTRHVFRCLSDGTDVSGERHCDLRNLKTRFGTTCNVCMMYN